MAKLERFGELARASAAKILMAGALAAALMGSGEAALAADPAPAAPAAAAAKAPATQADWEDYLSRERGELLGAIVMGTRAAGSQAEQFQDYVGLKKGSYLRKIAKDYDSFDPAAAAEIMAKYPNADRYAQEFEAGWKAASAGMGAGAEAKLNLGNLENFKGKKADPGLERSGPGMR